MIGRGGHMLADNDFNYRIFDLFLVFSRLEYALTRANGFAWGKDGGPVYGNWRMLAERLGQEFFDTQRADRAKSILWNEPPGRWTAKKDESGSILPVWFSRPAPTELELSFEPIAWVRNCVIHGESQDMVVRYEQLVTAAVKVLEATVERCMDQDDLKEIADIFTRSRIQDPRHQN